MNITVTPDKQDKPDKEIRWVGSSFDGVGAGVREIRIKDAQGIYRVMYVAKFEEAIYVLHCFQKKTETTSKHDKEIAETRYRSVLHARKDTR
jgi:phage-related protein